MELILTAICIVVLCLLTVIWIKHTKELLENPAHPEGEGLGRLLYLSQ